ncbi:NAD(P)-dependent oxidoreductase [Flavobacterium sp. LB2P84]|uniref:NAD-dependent epimerase/dehydratase family protein n=1 Tax=Flavobacterium yafengii TaxID=3041253 RepID=UPI0024A7B274|nr:NAD(P)-dependent oxidoreductase [Flavobacterium yafengii]MDI6034449.1 NAD(P)-dependent oxidoreductase [Flavobacterium yafengii]
MVKKKVLVTGGSGYVGARLCLHLANEGYAVTSLCHSIIPSDESWVSKMDRVLIGDVRDENFLYELAEYKYDVLIHLVSLDHHQSNGLPSVVSSVNITPVWSLLDIFSKQGLGKFIYFSTAQVYGTLQNEVVVENRNLNTQNAYSLTHHIGEVICEHYNRTTAVDCRVIRLSNSYGAPIFEENNCWWLVVNDLCRMAYTQKEIVLQSDGSPQRDFIHGWDVSRGVQAIIETSQTHVTYNLSSGTTLSIMDIAQKIKTVYADRYGKELFITATERKNNLVVSMYKIDNSLISAIGFEPKWLLEDGINDLFDYLESKSI